MRRAVPTYDAYRGADLGRHTIAYEEADAALYALAVGAPADRLDLVYERDLRTLPTYAAALGLWSTSVAARVVGYDVVGVLHVGQRLRMREPLPPAAKVAMTARIAAVYDKGSAGLVEVLVESDHFEATYRMFVPGLGGWGGERGPAAPTATMALDGPPRRVTVPANAAALYRLTGDRHPVHIDPEVATGTGLRAPILHGLCTLGIVARESAALIGTHPADLVELEASLRAPVYPGETIAVRAGESADGTAEARAAVDDTTVLTLTGLRYGPASR